MLPALQYEASLRSTAQLPDLEKRHLAAFKRLNDQILKMIQVLK
jgi:N-acetylated-alpha-linked acidic dipeptidase